MRPDTFAGPMERNESPENVSLSGLGPGLASLLPPGFVDPAADFSAGFSAGFAADLVAAGLALEVCAFAWGASSASRATRDRHAWGADASCSRSWWRWGALETARTPCGVGRDP
jgi:hypothetical protein